jgi:hypothetical protein
MGSNSFCLHWKLPFLLKRMLAHAADWLTISLFPVRHNWKILDIERFDLNGAQYSKNLNRPIVI